MIVRAADAVPGRLAGLSVRVGQTTLIAGDGRVVGDSTQTPAELQTLESHASRPEVLSAGETSVGISQRYSTTLQTDMVYVAIRSNHPVVKYVRLALPRQRLYSSAQIKPT